MLRAINFDISLGEFTTFININYLYHSIEKYVNYEDRLYDAIIHPFPFMDK